MEEYKFFSKGLLQKANNAAHAEKRSRCINPSLIDSLPDNFIGHVISMFYHRDNEVRLSVEINENGNCELIDISERRYNTLPSIKYLEDGTFKVNLSQSPYPNGREWREVEIIKPLRKRNFRTEVLSKYNFTCAVCDIKDKRLLRAAHIVVVTDGGEDTISNGISLCVNHEIAFDRGLLKILPNYEVQASQDIEIKVNKLKLPLKEEDFPSPNYLSEKLLLFSDNRNKK